MFAVLGLSASVTVPGSSPNPLTAAGSGCPKPQVPFVSARETACPTFADCMSNARAEDYQSLMGGRPWLWGQYDQYIPPWDRGTSAICQSVCRRYRSSPGWRRSASCSGHMLHGVRLSDLHVDSWRTSINALSNSTFRPAMQRSRSSGIPEGQSFRPVSNPLFRW